MKAKSWSRKQDSVLHAKNNRQMRITVFGAISPCLENGREIRFAKGIGVYSMTLRDLRNTFFDAWSIPWGYFNGFTAREGYQTILCALEITMSIRKLGLLWLSHELWANSIQTIFWLAKSTNKQDFMSFLVDIKTSILPKYRSDMQILLFDEARAHTCLDNQSFMEGYFKSLQIPVMSCEFNCR